MTDAENASQPQELAGAVRPTEVAAPVIRDVVSQWARPRNEEVHWELLPGITPTPNGQVQGFIGVFLEMKMNLGMYLSRILMMKPHQLLDVEDLSKIVVANLDQMVNDRSQALAQAMAQANGNGLPEGPMGGPMGPTTPGGLILPQ